MNSSEERVLLYFLACVFLFRLGNAARLSELGEMLSQGNPRTAAPFMSACVVVTQLTIAASAAWIGVAPRAAVEDLCSSSATARYQSAECSTR